MHLSTPCHTCRPCFHCSPKSGCRACQCPTPCLRLDRTQTALPAPSPTQSLLNLSGPLCSLPLLPIATSYLLMHPFGGGVKPKAAPLLSTGPAHPTSNIFSLCTPSSTHSWLSVTKATQINSLPLPPAAFWNPSFISKSSYLIPDLPPSLFLPTFKGAECPP